MFVCLAIQRHEEHLLLPSTISFCDRKERDTIYPPQYQFFLFLSIPLGLQQNFAELQLLPEAPNAGQASIIIGGSFSCAGCKRYNIGRKCDPQFKDFKTHLQNVEVFDVLFRVVSYILSTLTLKCFLYHM